ncbi:hypothetical protein Taro_029364 [Colocasia esculenta]|uniref:Protein kinase domain-containing protein n=1 Tax=Colocasia esculenta TaxID=4460 RepID=A0A843VWY6_COLES|nr:hypothetical protein [Colocasia esculenta]
MSEFTKEQSEDVDLIVENNLIILWLNPVCPTSLPERIWPVRRRDCREWCGGVQIPYPFGVGPDCYKNANFSVSCENGTTSLDPKPYFNLNGIKKEVMDISLPLGEIRTRSFISQACYNGTSGRVNRTGMMNSLNVSGTNYRFSHTRNVLTAIGCYNLAYISGFDEDQKSHITGCLTMCHTYFDGEMQSGACSGEGCCQISIPEGLNFYRVFFYNLTDWDIIQLSSPCVNGFLAENGSYTFNASDLVDPKFEEKNRDAIPLVLDWIVGGDKCEQPGLRNSSSYACVSDNSECLNSESGKGYFCTCAAGYEGNPYLQDGCRDIDECEKGSVKCPDGARCQNTPGNYTCIDFTPAPPAGKKPFPTVELALGLTLGILLLSILAFCICWILQRRKIMLSRQKFFEQNGGLLLRRQMNSQHGATFKIFTKEELDKATNMFDKEMILGQGGQGTVYKGNLDNREVAIKKSRVIDESQRNEFAREMLILSQINHRNVVKLLGCCLEVDIPMLVYEFISNGTFFHYIHKVKHKSPIPFTERLRMAYEAAQALNYLHAEASPPIVHGDVKSGNILIDDKLMAKVSDFGASKMTPLDREQFATLVQGTYGYLDPESLQTHHLTAKSDVYSFGVILAELLTRKTALYSDGSGKERSLALDFVSSVKGDQLLEILDAQIVDEGNIEYVKEVAKLTCRCLNMKGEERPTMKEVAMELEGVRNLILSLSQPYINADDMEPLLDEEYSSGYASTSKTSSYFISTTNALSIQGLI